MSDNILLHVDHVTRIYGRGERQFTAVKDINLTIREGEFVALLGPSGCGKSTLLRMITGLIAPSAGTVYYRDKPVKGINPYATMVFQTFALYPWLSVLDNVALALEARGNMSEQRFKDAEKLVDLVGLDGFENAYPRELSGGMRQKVGFARALAVEPELLCLDEPFSALDVLSAESLRGELMELWTGGLLPTKAILMVSHNIEEAISMADRVVVMGKEPGHIVTEFTVDLPHPRSRKEAGFETLIDRVYGAIAGRTEPEVKEVGTAPGTPGPTRILPRSSVSALAGLVEHLSQFDQSHDIYRLEDELGIEMGELVQTIEMAEILGFATVNAGDIQITPLGQAFAEASILTRKELFAQRARRLPMIQWMVQMLNVAPNRELPWKLFYTALLPEFPDEVAERQLEIAIDWGRYAELIDYDDSDEVLSLAVPDSKAVAAAN
ncbi:MAG: nitrate/sulfonate/bicarbonate ABC transporter ATP-binding protein [Anaerolineae bacterium]|nr:nitrate/sulfonate/bicarbonate ABC transporter ATP-binding protein [Anaerolineae bacterium]